MSVFPRTQVSGRGGISFFSEKPAPPASIDQAADDLLQKRGVLFARPQHRHHRAEYEGYELLTGEGFRKSVGPHTGVPGKYGQHARSNVLPILHFQRFSLLALGLVQACQLPQEGVLKLGQMRAQRGIDLPAYGCKYSCRMRNPEREG